MLLLQLLRRLRLSLLQTWLARPAQTRVLSHQAQAQANYLTVTLCPRLWVRWLRGR